MGKLTLWITSVALIALQLPNANAITFDWNYSGTSVSGSGILDATDQGGGVFLVDSISGTANGLNIIGLTIYGGQDQLLYPTAVRDGISDQLDGLGLAFAVSGGALFNLYSYPATLYSGFGCGSVYCLLGPGTSPTSYLPYYHDKITPVTFSANVAVGVPGPIIGAGLPGLVFAAGGLFAWWRRRNNRSPSLATA